MALVDKLGVLRRIMGADPQFEIGGITEVAAGLPECPACCSTTSKAIRAAFASSPMRPPMCNGPRWRWASIRRCGRSTHSKPGWKSAKRLRAAAAGYRQARGVPGKLLDGADVDVALFRRRSGTAMMAGRSSARARSWSCAIPIPAGSTHRSIAFKSTGRTKSRCSSIMAAAMARSSPRNIGIAARAVRSRSCTAKIRRCSLPASNICPTAAPNTSSPAPSRARRSKCSPDRRPDCRSRRMPRSFSKAGCCR